MQTKWKGIWMQFHTFSPYYTLLQEWRAVVLVECVECHLLVIFISAGHLSFHKVPLLVSYKIFLPFNNLFVKCFLLKNVFFCLWTASSPVGATEDPSVEELSGVHGGGRALCDVPRASTSVQSTIISSLSHFSHRCARTACQTTIHHRSDISPKITKIKPIGLFVFSLQSSSFLFNKTKF